MVLQTKDYGSVKTRSWARDPTGSVVAITVVEIDERHQVVYIRPSHLICRSSIIQHSLHILSQQSLKYPVQSSTPVYVSPS